MIDYASMIRTRLTMGEVLERYGFCNSSEKGRIPCPIHSGKDRNFAFTPNGYHCFVCNSHGDVINFVEELFRIDFRSAIRKLNEDFSLELPIQTSLDANKLRELKKKSDEIRKQREANKRERDAIYKRYSDALTRFIEFDRIIQNERPTDIFDDISDRYANALKLYEWAEYELDKASDALYQYNHKPEVKIA